MYFAFLDQYSCLGKKASETEFRSESRRILWDLGMIWEWKQPGGQLWQQPVSQTDRWREMVNKKRRRLHTCQHHQFLWESPAFWPLPQLKPWLVISPIIFSIFHVDSRIKTPLLFKADWHLQTIFLFQKLKNLENPQVFNLFAWMYHKWWMKHV